MDQAIHKNNFYNFLKNSIFFNVYIILEAPRTLHELAQCPKN